MNLKKEDISVEEKELTAGQKLRKALSYQKKNGYDRLLPGELEAMDVYCEGYKQYLEPNCNIC